MEGIYRRYRDHVACFVVSMPEVHPTDGWQTVRHVAEGSLFRLHQSDAERETVAATCHLDLHLPLPVLIAERGHAIDAAYGVAPERLSLIGGDGRVAYQGGAGPPFFALAAWKQAIAARVHALVASERVPRLCGLR